MNKNDPDNYSNLQDALEKTLRSEKTLNHIAKFKPVKETKLRFVTIHANPIAEEIHEN